MNGRDVPKRRSTGALHNLADTRRAAAVAKRFGVRRCRAAFGLATSSAPPVGKMRWGLPVDSKAPEHRRTPRPGGCTTRGGGREAFWSAALPRRFGSPDIVCTPGREDALRSAGARIGKRRSTGALHNLADARRAVGFPGDF
jgi:hypothetical protein